MIRCCGCRFGWIVDRVLFELYYYFKFESTTINCHFRKTERNVVYLLFFVDFSILLKYYESTLMVHFQILNPKPAYA